MYGFSVDKGDEVVIGLYYKQCGCKESTYELLNEELCLHLLKLGYC